MESQLGLKQVNMLRHNNTWITRGGLEIGGVGQKMIQKIDETINWSIKFIFICVKPMGLVHQHEQMIASDQKMETH